MNYLGIVISFTIGGLLIVAILTLNGRVIQNSGETVLDMSAKQTTKTISDVMRRDFQRLGHNLDTGCDEAIISFNASQITFCADIDTVSSTTARQITWEYSSDSVPSTPNPNDNFLYRRSGPSGSATVSRFPVTQFKFRYADQDGDSVYSGGNEELIREIFAEIESQSADKYGDSGYSKSRLEKSFSPPSLKIQDRAW